MHPRTGLHASLVHRLASSQNEGLFVYTHPDDGLHVSWVQGFPSEQPRAAPGAQTPLAQASPSVHALPSLQLPATFAWPHPLAGLQVSFVQGFPSLQLSGAPGWPAPFTQVSAPLQTFPSEHWAFPVHVWDALPQVTDSFGRSVAFVVSLPRTQTWVFDRGMKIQPKFVAGAFDHPCTVAVTSIEAVPSAEGAGPSRGPISSGWTPGSPPKLFQLAVSWSHGTRHACISPGGPAAITVMLS